MIEPKQFQSEIEMKDRAQASKINKRNSMPKTEKKEEEEVRENNCV